MDKSKERYDANGFFKADTFGGRSGAVQYYLNSDNMAVIDDDVFFEQIPPYGYQFFVPEVVARVNKHRMELRAKAMAVYGD